MIADLFIEHLRAVIKRRESTFFFDSPESQRDYNARCHNLEGIVIMAAGEGKRMGELSKAKPKPFLECQGRPLIDNILEPALKQFDSRDVTVVIRGDENFSGFQKYLDSRNVRILYQQAKLTNQYLLAFLSDFYSSWNSNIFREYGKLLVFPADAVFGEEPDFRNMLSYAGSKDVLIVMANAPADESNMLLKPLFGDERFGMLRDFKVRKPHEDAPQGYKAALHTGGFAIKTDLLYNPFKVAALAAAFALNKGWVATHRYFSASPFPKVGYYFIEGSFRGISTPEDLNRTMRGEISKPRAP